MEEVTQNTATTATILVADDDESLRETLAEQLRIKGFTVLTAADGDQALAQALEHHPDLTVLDVVMPGKTGTEVLSAIREDAWGKTAKVVMASNVSSTDVYNQALESGANDFYSKSEVSLEDMVNFISERVA